MPTITLDELRDACLTGAAIRYNATLQPAAGPGSKVFPPTYEGGQYAVEQRVIDGERLPCVLLDSVQSQANRMELALLDAHREGRIGIPVIEVDFAAAGMSEVGSVTSLEAPNRIADAILRDSESNGTKFRETDVGKVLDSATVANATGLLAWCPTALVFGVWDSTGPRGGLGAKFARSLVGEVFAVDAEPGVRPSSRIDPLGIEIIDAPLFKAYGGGWTLDPNEAEHDKKKPVKLGKDGKPSEANHGNVTPSLGKPGQPNHGGVTFRYARQSVVISLTSLRRLRFPLGDEATRASDEAARVALAALGLCGAALAVERGLDLRSRCLLVPESPTAASFELVAANGATSTFDVTAESAVELLNDAVESAKQVDLPWRSEGLTLTPGKNLAELVKRSREKSEQSAPEA
ncbi:MAG: type I-U CRISPR-associated protein Cas7 [Myxococcales bacterium]|nr:type I-U CRISPR-associated protein Cas7 [Myxococcales bacterium]